MAQTILIIDDDSFVSQALHDLLSFHELTGNILHASDGQKGLKIALESEPDAIFVDYNMPVMDGLTFVKELRAHSAQDSLPLVMMTAEDNLGSTSLIEMRSHCKGVLNKPFTFDEVFSVLDSVLGAAVA